MDAGLPGIPEGRADIKDKSNYKPKIVLNQDLKHKSRKKNH